MKLRGFCSASLAAVLLTCGCVHGNKTATVTAILETEPVQSPGDAADDPAIWVHPSNASKSLILGTDKRAGLDVYGLDGNRRQHLAIGRLNNVDLRQRVNWGGSLMDVAVASNRSNQCIEIFLVDHESGHVTHSIADRVPLAHAEPYGICMFHDPSAEAIYAFVNYKNGKYEQFALVPNGNSQLVREFQIESQPEGCVVDDRSGVIFIGEEERGVWKASAYPSSDFEPALIATLRAGLRADVEGLALIDSESGQYLIVSSQGNSSYVIYSGAGKHERIGRFRIVRNQERGIDGASETDGIAAIGNPFGNLFPYGLLVVQDDKNTHPNARQNFKLVSWRDVEIALNLMP